MKFHVRHNDAVIQVACPGSEEYGDFKIGGEFHAGGLVEAMTPYDAIASYVTDTQRAYWEASLQTRPRQVDIRWGAALVGGGRG